MNCYDFFEITHKTKQNHHKAQGNGILQIELKQRVFKYWRIKITTISLSLPRKSFRIAALHR